MRVTAEFVRIACNSVITREQYPDFYFELQRAVLMSLKDSGNLNQMQYRAAEIILEKQCREVLAMRQNTGETVD